VHDVVDDAAAMLMSLGRSTAVYAYPAPVDLRKGYNGLCGLVLQTWQRNVLAGGLYLFVNRPRNGCKVLTWDGTGLCIFAKRLERGRFAALWRSATQGQIVDVATSLTLTTTELALFIEGCALVGKQTLSPPSITF
jgi:transposase